MITKSKKEIIGDIMKDYENFIRKTEEFTEITNKIGMNYHLKLDNSSQLDKDITRKAEEIKNNVFKIFVTGEAKSGKSTFINAFLGIDLLPSGGAQCTSSIIEIKRGEKIKLIAEEITGNKIEKFGENDVKEFLSNKASILGNSKDQNNEFVYEGVPFNIVNGFLKEFKDNYKDEDIEKFLKEIKKEKPNNLDDIKYSENIKNYIKNTDWRTIIEKLTIEYPLESLKEVTILDSPGVGAVGGFGKITEKVIKEVDAIIFIKSITGEAMDSLSFKNFFESVDESDRKNKNLKTKKKDTTFLVFTFKNTPGVKLEERKNEAYKIFNEIKEDNIFFVDSFSELNFLKYKDFNTIEELDDFLAEDNIRDEDKNFEIEFGKLSKFRRKNDDIVDFLDEMKKYSGIYEFKKKIETFMYNAPFYKLKDFLEKLLQKSEELKETLNTIMNKAKQNKENPKELQKSIDKTSEEIKEFQSVLNDSIEELREKYISSNENSIVKKQINEFKNDFFEKIKLNTLDINKFSNLKSFNDSIKEELENFFQNLEIIKINITETFYREGNEILLKNKEKINIKLESILPKIKEDDIENIFKEAKENSKEEIDDTGILGEVANFLTFGLWGRSTKIINNPQKERELIYEGIKLKISDNIPKIQKIIMDDIKCALNKYKEAVKNNLQNARKRLDTFSKQLEDSNRAIRAIEITKNIEKFYIESIDKFNKNLNKINEKI